MAKLERCLRVVERNQQKADFLVAFSSNDRRSVDQHFGLAESFMVYGINQHQVYLHEVLQLQAAPQGHDQGKLHSRIVQLAEVDAVYTAACGPAAVVQLKQAGITVITVELGVAIDDLLAQIVEDYLSQPLHWMMSSKQKLARLEGMLEEDWS